MHYIDINSELALELDPDLARWAGVLRTNTLLADIYDMLAMINANLCAMGTGKRAKKPKGYPRPTDKDKQKIGGKNALPPDQLRAWFEKKREDRKKQHK